MSGVLAVRPGGLRPVSVLRSAARRTTSPTRGRGRRPEWWLYAVAVAGWVALLEAGLGGLRDLTGGAGAPDTAGDGASRGHAHHGSATADGSWWGAVSGDPWLHHGLLTLAMVAVMLPLVAPNVRYVALRCPRAARRRVSVAVVAGWASVWLPAGLLVALLGVVLASVAGPVAAVAVVTLGAAGWQGSRTKRRSVARCHRVLAPPLDPGSARSAARAFGRGLGRDCATSCLPMMLLMAVTAHSLLVTLAVTGVASYERRRRPHHDQAPRRTAAVVAAAGAAALLVAVVVPSASLTG